MKELLKKWEGFDPKIKHRIVIGIVISFLMIVLYGYASTREESIRVQQQPKDTNVTTDILTGRDTSNLGIEGNSNNIKKLRSEISLMTDKLDVFMSKTEQNFAKNNNKALHGKIVEIGANLKGLERKYQQQISTAINLKDQLNQQSKKIGKIETSDMNNQQVILEPSSEWDIPVNSEEDSFSPARDLEVKPIKIIVISSENSTASPKKKKSKIESESIFVPAGSILSGTLITGMDAPANESTRNEPFPTLLRIKGEAILPNRFRMDLRECFIIASGYGDLSSERAYIRGETISCINEKEEILESPIDLYAVGEDGKIGIRGRLVSKNGQVLARALMAGFMQGVSTAFQPQAVPSVSLQPGQNVSFQSLVSKDALGSALLGGTSKALDRLADYYIKIAEGIFPVIEIDAGRKIDLIVKKGIKLNFEKKN